MWVINEANLLACHCNVHCTSTWNMKSFPFLYHFPWSSRDSLQNPKLYKQQDWKACTSSWWMTGLEKCIWLIWAPRKRPPISSPGTSHFCSKMMAFWNFWIRNHWGLQWNILFLLSLCSLHHLRAWEINWSCDANLQVTAWLPVVSLLNSRDANKWYQDDKSLILLFKMPGYLLFVTPPI